MTQAQDFTTPFRRAVSGKMTVEEFADIIQVSWPTASKMLDNPKLLKVGHLQLIAPSLGMTPFQVAALCTNNFAE